jgi:predicted nucleotidyltransferase
MKSLDNVSLIKKEQEAMNAAVRVLKSQFSVERVILFGSKARGDSSEHSDIDLLLITSHPIHWREEKAIVEALFDLGMKYDVIFSPMFASLEEWERGIFKEFPIYREIMEEGAIVP